MDWNELGAGITIECNNKIELKEEQKIILSVNGYGLESVIRRIIPKKGGTNIGLIFTSLNYEQYAYLITQTYAVASSELPIREEKGNNIGKLLFDIFKGHFILKKK